MSQARVVNFPAPANPIRPSPGFAKKKLATRKLDIIGLCGFGCRYCSSNAGNYLRINRRRFADETEAQLGERLLPAEAPELTFEWKGVVDRLREQIKRKPADWGEGETLVFSMLTDGFSPRLVKSGVTLCVLQRVLNDTRFRVRVLTKNAAVGSRNWVQFFKFWRDRVIVGLSIGTLDDAWAKKIEVGTSSPSARVRALRRLQDSGVPTYGMLCPVFPDVMAGAGVEGLVDEIRPWRCAEVFAEPYNDRANWSRVAEGYAEGSAGRRWLERCYGEGQRWMWSDYATDLYRRIKRRHEFHGAGIDGLRYLLYEKGILADDVADLSDFSGILFQSKPGADGLSQNPAIRARQQGRFPELPDEAQIVL